jgi:hypothetical protein
VRASVLVNEELDDMKELRVYHWSSFLIPGGLCLVLVAATLIPRSHMDNVLSRLTPSSTSIIILVSIVAAYLMGALLWGFSYTISVGSLGLFFVRPRRSRIGGDTPVTSMQGGGYSEFRVSRAESIARKIEREMKAEFHTIMLPKFESYVRFRLEAFRAMEALPNSLGQRIASQWELLGVFQAIMSVWLLGSAFAVASFVAQRMSFLGETYLVTNSMGRFILVLAVHMALLAWTALAFHQRNIVFADDVICASAVMALDKSAESGESVGPSKAN